jgi:hypothetical protein
MIFIAEPYNIWLAIARELPNEICRDHFDGRIAWLSTNLRNPGLFNSLRRYHAAIGAVALVAFALSGQYMHWGLGHLRDMPDVPRLMYRSSHIYLLMAGLLNVALGLYLQLRTAGPARAAQVAGSLMLFASPVFFGWSFWVESQQPSIERHLLRLGIYSSFGGTLLHAVAAWLSRRRTRRNRLTLQLFVGARNGA